MNILFLIGKYPNYGGTEVVTTVLANAFARKGYRVSIASFEQTVPELKSELDSGVELFDLSYPVWKKSNISTLHNIIVTKQIDFILNQWCLPFFVTKLCNEAIKNTNCKLLSVLHGVPDQNKRLLTVENKIKGATNPILSCCYELFHKTLLFATSLNLRYVYNHSNKYVVLSDSFINSFVSLARIRETSKLVSIENPLTISNKGYQFDPVSKQKEKTILYIGRMDYANKRVHRVVEAWEKVYESYPDWNMILVGDGPEKKSLEEYVNSRNIRNIRFEGFRKEPPTRFYLQASILLLTSELEGFGLVVIEGMSFGVVPIVYGSYLAIYDIIENRKNGFITPVPYNEDNTVNCLRHLMDNPDILQDMANKSISSARKFSLEEIVKKWDTLFEELTIKNRTEK